MAAAAGAIGISGEAVVLIDTGLVVVRVTARAFRLVSRRLPVNYLRIALVTPGAVEIATMVQRLVRQRRVREVVGQPGRRVVTIVAFPGGNEVAWIYAGRYRAIVTGRTRSEHLRVIHHRRRCKHSSVMAVLANIRRLYMGRILAGCLGAVVTAEAAIDDVDMIEVRWQPRDCRMTVVAVVASRDMRWILARCDGAVVAGAAGANDLRMVNSIGRRPYGVVVAILANVGHENVVLASAGGVGAVVAADTVAGNIGVIKVGRYPCGGRMTVIAVVTRRDVRWILARCDGAVVTGAAGADDLRMVHKICRCPHSIVVAVLANVGGLDVGRVLPGCIGAVVAGSTGCRNVGVIKGCR